jgi:squalene-associated FAD-dependent desaturase
MNRPPRVIIVGAGLAGMAAAVALESTGLCDVTLVESRRSLGGRAGSFQDPQTGEELDNCQHVLLGCCTNLIDFYRRIGTLEQIRFDRTIHFRDEYGRRHDLYGVRGLPAPLNLSMSLLRFGALNISEKSALTRAMLAMLDMGHAGRLRLRDTSFGTWLDEQKQPSSLVNRFYDPIIVSGLNENTRAASAAYAIKIFQDAMFANTDGYVMGVPNCPLSRLYRSIPVRDVQLGTRVTGLRIETGRVTGVTLQNGDVLSADAVVLATNFHAIDKWIDEPWLSRDTRFANLNQIDSVPILGVHLWFDRSVLAEPHAAFMSGPLQWVFRKDDTGRSVHGVISAARQWVGRDKDEMLDRFTEQLRAMLPDAANAKLERGVVVVEKRATFSALPGIDRLRPSQAPPQGGLSNLYLAGDYTQTGWPATMEGAVRSGYLAADAVLARLAPQLARTSFLVDDLPIEWPARLLGLERAPRT